jgi:HAMP domain-containing protein
MERSLRINPNLVRVMLTAYMSGPEMIDAINSGHINFFVAKPVGIEGLQSLAGALKSMVTAVKRRNQSSDPRIGVFRAAAKAMAAGDMTVTFPRGANDDLGQLGEALSDLAQTTNSRIGTLNRLIELSNKISGSVQVSDVLEHLYGSFRPVVPYSRVALAALTDDQSWLRTVWANQTENLKAAGLPCPLPKLVCSFTGNRAPRIIR